MKKSRQILYLIILIFSLNVSNVLAADNIKKYPAPDVEKRSYSTTVTYNKYLYDNILNGLINLKDKVDTSAYSKNADEVFKVLEKVLDDHPEIFYFDYENCSFWSNGILELGYRGNKETINTMRQQLDTKVQSIINNVITKDMSELQKEMAIHDYIVLNTKYDEEALNGNISSELIFTSYGCLVNNFAVCDGYAKAMQLLLNKVGVYTIRVTGDGNGVSHAWNIVRINGKNYQVDATWNDPVPDSGYVRYKYFNMSDADIAKDHHWVKSDFPACNDNSFKYLHKADYVVKDLDYIYYSNNEDDYNLYKMKIDGSNNQMLTEDRAVNLVYYNDYIYFSNYSDGGTLYKVKNDGTELEQILDNHVENLHYSNGYLTYHNEDLSKDEKMKLEQIVYEVENKEKFNEIFSSYKDWGQAKEVPRNKIWKISFNRAVNSENLKDQVYVMDSSFNKVTDIDVNINEGKNIIITKKASYKRGGLYYLVISKPIKDIKGKEIKEPVVMRFKVY
ncbi:DUF5050 domain-containing protein [Clostridium botulinum]|nr:DUF5050 domain-containing protein [Clostridium botulinum]NFD34095.1 DUF5050 domain-containing protein [Clostridium botulinum]NFD60759.1 DUF5050 domain-containing protein [Clostridium botulinum]NFE03010.1 DUF5050 domain-containing protein [Clostridium botulinum]